MTNISIKNLSLALYLGSKDKSEEEQKVFFKKTLNFLYKNSLFLKTNEIILELKKIINKENNTEDVKIWSSVQIDEENEKKIIKALNKIYPTKNFLLKKFIDEKMIAGFKIRVNDDVVDLSIKNKINKLQEYLNKENE